MQVYHQQFVMGVSYPLMGKMRPTFVLSSQNVSFSCDSLARLSINPFFPFMNELNATFSPFNEEIGSVQPTDWRR